MHEPRYNRKGVILVTGAAGFIGSALIDSLLDRGNSVIGVDDLSRGSEQNLASAMNNGQFRFHKVDLADEADIREQLIPRLAGMQIAEVWHLAANSDIPAGVQDPHVDHRNTFMTTFNVLSVMKDLQIPVMVFASTSAVYGNSKVQLHENYGPLLPISNYGAMKLASEASISAAVEAHLDRAYIFRFPNVIGPRLTHGAIFDFFRKLSVSPGELEVLGDGTQKKPYLHVSELIKAMIYIRENSSDTINLFNIGPADTGVTVAQIAQEVVAKRNPTAKIHFTGGDRGWIGDVPRFTYSIAKLAELGWHPTLSSLEAIKRTIEENLDNVGIA